MIREGVHIKRYSGSVVLLTQVAVACLALAACSTPSSEPSSDKKVTIYGVYTDAQAQATKAATEDLSKRNYAAGDIIFSEGEAGELRARCAWQRQQGHLADWLDADEVRVRWPWLGPTAGALWAPHEGALLVRPASSLPARSRRPPPR